MRGPGHGVGLFHIGQRANHHELTVVAYQLGRHALELGAKKHIEKEGGHHVVAVVAQRNLVAAQAARHGVQNASAQARAQAAHGFAFGHDFFHHAVGVLRFDMKRHTGFLQISGQHIGRKARLLLVQIDRHQLERYRRALLQLLQNIEQGVTVFAAANADHDTIARFDHVVVHNRLAGQTAQALFELDGFTPRLGLLCLGGCRNRGRIGGGFIQ